ncbi:sigma-70 family RNA polymerase sigma factor [Reyranella sp. CPCC 100927]|uniref:sigma-70 family RNA polymerase sigma factor n=1 Tax=Reyranella sp. CPCC 100927 TaxID=2599616 RepID=UPI00351A775C
MMPVSITYPAGRVVWRGRTDWGLMKQATDLDVEEALRRCAAGDAGALRAIFEREAPRMIGVAQRIVRRRALAEEVVQDSFVQIWRRAASFDAARGAGRTWIYAIVRHRAISILRDERRLELDADGDPTATVSEESSDDIVTKLSDSSSLRRCLEHLEERARKLIVLTYVHGLSHTELAAREGVPLGTVKSWIRRGALALRECLG